MLVMDQSTIWQLHKKLHFTVLSASWISEVRLLLESSLLWHEVILFTAVWLLFLQLPAQVLSTGAGVRERMMSSVWGTRLYRCCGVSARMKVRFLFLGVSSDMHAVCRWVEEVQLSPSLTLNIECHGCCVKVFILVAENWVWFAERQVWLRRVTIFGRWG